jgi:hypothetical protein
MKLASRACVWWVVLGLFTWYGGLSGAAGADVVTTNNPRQDLLGLRQVW